MTDQTQTPDSIGITSLITSECKQPLIALTWGENTLHLDPEGARALGYQLVHAAETAESESLLLRFMESMSGSALPDNVQAQALVRFRQLRQEAGQVDVTRGAEGQG